MKIIKLAYIFFIIISLNGCDKETEPVIEIVPTCQIQTFQLDGYSEPFYFNYNEDGNPESLIAGFRSIYAHYTNEKISLIEVYYNDDLSLQYEIQYSGNEFHKWVGTSPNNDRIIEYLFFFDDSKISKIEFWVNYDENGTGNELFLSRVREFSFTNKNVIKLIDYEHVNPSGYPPNHLTFDMSFDENRNPFYKNILYLFYLNEFELYYSQNNILTTTTDYNDGRIVNYKYAYEYNDLGFPLVISYSINDSAFEELASLTYDCNN